MKKDIGKILQKRADDLKDQKIVDALIKADLSGLTKEQRGVKLKSIINKIENG